MFLRKLVFVQKRIEGNYEHYGLEFYRIGDRNLKPLLNSNSKLWGLWCFMLCHRCLLSIW